MRESTGSVFLYNIIIIFILVVFAFIGATLSYYKAFKVNTVLINSIEKYEGVNNLSSNEIERKLSTLGYEVRINFICPSRNGMDPIAISNHLHRYCVYLYSNVNNYIVYEAVSYLTIDLPVIGDNFSIPVASRTKRIYTFN